MRRANISSRATKNRNKRPISYTHINREESLTCKGIVCSVRGFLHSIIGKRQRKLLDVERIARLIKVSEDDVRKWIDENFCVVK